MTSAIIEKPEGSEAMLKTLSLFSVVFVSPLLVLAGPGEPQSNPQKAPTRLRLDVFRIDAAMIAARSQGLFAAEGVTPEITVASNSTQQMRGLINGTYDVVSTGFDNVLAWSGKEGVEIIAVLQTADRIFSPVFARPEIKNWSDLKGKKLAVDAPDTAFALVLRRILLAHNLDLQRGDYQLVSAGSTAQRLESMKRGETLAAILNAPFDTQATQAGMVRLGDSSEVLPNYPDSALAVSRAWVQDHRKELVGFLRAWLAGARWVREPANREAAIKLVSTELGLSPPAATGVLSRISANGMLNLAGLQSVLDLRTQFGFTLPKGSSLEAYYDTSYYREAVGR